MADRAAVVAIATPQISRDEGGFVATAYPDPNTKREPWTAGFGSTGPTIVEGTVLTLAEAEALRDAYIAKVCDTFDERIPWWRDMDAVRAAVLLNMGYNMGPVGLVEKFPKMLAAAQARNWGQCAYQILSPPTWLNQVHGRAERCSVQIHTGTVQ